MLAGHLPVVILEVALWLRVLIHLFAGIKRQHLPIAFVGPYWLVHKVVLAIASCYRVYLARHCGYRSYWLERHLMVLCHQKYKPKCYRYVQLDFLAA